MHDETDPVLTDPVLSALRAALSARPDPALHLALGDRLLALGRPGDALEAYATVLSTEPAHVEALGKAAAACQAAGLIERAAGYRRLHQALTGTTTAGPNPLRLAAARNAAEGGGADVPDADDEAEEAEDGDRPPPAHQGRPGNVIRLVEPDPAPDATTFEDIGGLEAVKRRIDLSFLAPLRDPALFRAYGKAIKGGMLLYGPPGCGKTHIARATAGEVGARFTSVGLIDVLDMWIGESEKRLHELFEAARRQAPTVLFLDELDALGQKRSQLRHNAGRNLVNQLLVELDGLDSGDGVYVIAATNHPWDVDAALKRPGRFDRTVLVPPPDAPARAHILRRHMRGRPQEGLDFAVLAARTDRFSGADLVHLADTAVEGVLEEALQGGGLRPVRMSDFGRALTEVKSSIGPWVEVARNYALYANESGAWDELAAWLKGLRG